ncbi:MAG: hypothetical protein KDE47_19695 [Caldilineaceae bacterium]|nr:hypothetical protein [Caldilineaceae bacterium]MCB0096048.1 hypothetical protein [Caldilineaceae bacterium]
MGTRSFIVRQIDTGIEGVYCHWNGYPDYNGRILQEYYSEPEKLKRLIAGGEISSLAPEIGSQHDFDSRPKGQTTYYHRDRGDDWKDVRPRRFKTLKALCRHAQRCGCEYLYLFDGQNWQYAERGVQFFCLSDGSPFSAFKPLPAEIANT